MVNGTKKVWWIGGPFDGESFRVPYAQKTVKVGSTAFDVDLDANATTASVRTERELPIRCRGSRYYAIWAELHG